MFAPPTPLPDDPAALRVILLAALAEIERLRLILAGLQRNRFGRRSEQLHAEQLQQSAEDLEQAVAEQTPRVEAAVPKAERTRPPRRNRGARPTKYLIRWNNAEAATVKVRPSRHPSVPACAATTGTAMSEIATNESAVSPQSYGA